MTAIDRFAQWEDASTDDEWRIVEDYLYYHGYYWGNSYRAVTKTALDHCVPEYVVRGAIAHYAQVVDRDEV